MEEQVLDAIFELLMNRFKKEVMNICVHTKRTLVVNRAVHFPPAHPLMVAETNVSIYRFRNRTLVSSP